LDTVPGSITGSLRSLVAQPSFILLDESESISCHRVRGTRTRQESIQKRERGRDGSIGVAARMPAWAHAPPTTTPRTAQGEALNFILPFVLWPRAVTRCQRSESAHRTDLRNCSRSAPSTRVAPCAPSSRSQAARCKHQRGGVDPHAYAAAPGSADKQDAPCWRVGCQIGRSMERALGVVA
jgi:hypothetical protein